MQSLYNQKATGSCLWLLIGLWLHKRMWINYKWPHFWASCCDLSPAKLRVKTDFLVQIPDVSRAFKDTHLLVEANEASAEQLNFFFCKKNYAWSIELLSCMPNPKNFSITSITDLADFAVAASWSQKQFSSGFTYADLPGISIRRTTAWSTRFYIFYWNFFRIQMDLKNIQKEHIMEQSTLEK